MLHKQTPCFQEAIKRRSSGELPEGITRTKSGLLIPHSLVKQAEVTENSGILEGFDKPLATIESEIPARETAREEECVVADEKEGEQEDDDLLAPEDTETNNNCNLEITDNDLSNVIEKVDENKLITVIADPADTSALKESCGIEEITFNRNESTIFGERKHVTDTNNENDIFHGIVKRDANNDCHNDSSQGFSPEPLFEEVSCFGNRHSCLSPSKKALITEISPDTTTRVTKSESPITKTPTYEADFRFTETTGDISDMFVSRDDLMTSDMPPSKARDDLMTSDMPPSKTRDTSSLTLEAGVGARSTRDNVKPDVNKGCMDMLIKLSAINPEILSEVNTSTNDDLGMFSIFSYYGCICSKNVHVQFDYNLIS